MHVGLVGEVHQVVDHEPVVAADMVQPAAVGPFRLFRPFKVVDLIGIGEFLIAGPDPDEAVALFDRVAADAWETAHALAGHTDGLAFATHLEPVIAADQLAVTDEAERERRAPMRAKIFDCGHLATLAPVEHDLLAANLATQRPGRDLVRGARHIPCVFWEHACLLSCLHFTLRYSVH